ALKMRRRATSISSAEKLGCRLRCKIRSSSREASSVSTVWPDAEMSAPLVRVWWISQPPHPIARLTTASCNAKPSADEVSSATKPSSNSRHKSTKSIHDTTWAARGTLAACTRPAKRPAKRPASRFSSGSTVAALMGEPCHAIASLTSSGSQASLREAVVGSDHRGKRLLDIFDGYPRTFKNQPRPSLSSAGAEERIKVRSWENFVVIFWAACNTGSTPHLYPLPFTKWRGNRPRAP